MKFLFLSLLVLSIFVAGIHFSNANALEVRTVFDDNHSSATYGNSIICGDHKCAPGEKAHWFHATWGNQRPSSTKIPVAYYGEDIMSKLATYNANMTSHKNTHK